MANNTAKQSSDGASHDLHEHGYNQGDEKNVLRNLRNRGRRIQLGRNHCQEDRELDGEAEQSHEKSGDQSSPTFGVQEQRSEEPSNKGANCASRRDFGYVENNSYDSADDQPRKDR